MNMFTVIEILAALALLALLYVQWLKRRWLRFAELLHMPYRRGDYEAALQEAGIIKNVLNEYSYFRGRALLELGRLEEAEECLKTCSSYDLDRQAFFKETYGRVLMEQQRYDEAIAAFQEGITAWRQPGCCHRGIAEVLLRQGRRTDEALAEARLAVELDEAREAAAPNAQDLHPPQVRDWELGRSLSLLAWAVALYSKDAAEVEYLLAKAFTTCSYLTKPVSAQAHYHAGRAYAALGKIEKSASHFEQAANLDPNGNYGRLAASARGTTDRETNWTEPS